MSRQADLPLEAQYPLLTFEAGLVYAVLRGHVQAEHVTYVVDTVVGLLDRMPDARPRHPAATA